MTETKTGFGPAWELYAEKRCVNPYTLEQFLDWIYPLTSKDIEGRNVLDMGCGLGGMAAHAYDLGAYHVLGVDSSESILAGAPLLKDRPLLFLWRRDILNFNHAPFDLVLCIGVLHHLNNPFEGFKACVRHCKSGGRVLVWVYGEEGNSIVILFVEPLRKMFRNLPVKLVRKIAMIPSAILWGLCKLPSCVLKRLPMGAYLSWLAPYGFGYTVGMVTDQLIAPLTHYIPREEIESWCSRAGIEMESLTQRNGNSWRLIGRNK